MTITVRPAQKADIGALGHVLGRAFFEDPVASWIVPDRDRRAKSLHKFFATATRHHYLSGGGAEVASDDANIVAAALWSPPQRWRTSRWEDLRMAPTLILSMGKHGKRGQQVDTLMKAHHPEEPHWYLGVIGSDPAVRGGGYGRALMESRLQRCDAEFAPAYLESSNPDNVPYYQRFGFAVTGEIVLPDGGPTLAGMWREPR